MFQSTESLFSPENPYNQYVPILKQSFFERWESTVSILGGEYLGNDNDSRIIKMKHATINNNILKHSLKAHDTQSLFKVIYPKQFEFKLGVLADLLGAFVFDYIADQCYLLNKSMSDSSFASLLILFSLPIIVVEISAHFVSVFLRSILSSIVATILIPVILIFAAVCEMQNIYIQNEIYEAILNSYHDQELLVELREELFYVKEKNIYSIDQSTTKTSILDFSSNKADVMKFINSSIKKAINNGNLKDQSNGNLKDQSNGNPTYPDKFNFILKLSESEYKILKINPNNVEYGDELNEKSPTTNITNSDFIRFLDTKQLCKNDRLEFNTCLIEQETIKVFAVKKNHSSFFITNTNKNITALQKIAKCTLDSNFAVAVYKLSNSSSDSNPLIKS